MSYCASANLIQGSEQFLTPTVKWGDEQFLTPMVECGDGSLSFGDTYFNGRHCMLIIIKESRYRRTLLNVIIGAMRALKGEDLSWLKTCLMRDEEFLKKWLEETKGFKDALIKGFFKGFAKSTGLLQFFEKTGETRIQLKALLEDNGKIWTRTRDSDSVYRWKEVQYVQRDILNEGDEECYALLYDPKNGVLVFQGKVYIFPWDKVFDK